MNQILKDFLLYDLDNAKNTEDLKVILSRLIASIPTEEDQKEKFLKSLTDAMRTTR